jgi:GTPase-associated protein 1, N-terminal domain type 2/GTPase-associated protein 1, middle domain
MPFKQTYYTSCENGLRGGKGFQIHAATEGIEASALQEIERLGLYVPPVSSPSRPTPEEIKNFPISLLFQRLTDGGAILAQARYVGSDYSGRYGNYFTHSLILTNPERDLKEQGVLPIELWGAHSWTTTESATTSLPVLSRLQTAGIVHQEAVIDFLTANGRMEILPAFLTAVEGALSTGRRIVLVDSAQSVAMWISAASYVLPHHLTLKLTFNTYVKNPYLNDFLIVGTTTDSDFGFAPHEVNHQFFVFDFEGKRFTAITDITPFARMVSATFQLGHARVGNQFSDFVERVAPDFKIDELAQAFACHLISNGIELPDAVTPGTLAWCAIRLGNMDRDALKGTIDSIVERGSDSVAILDAYTSLYISALLPSTRADLRKAVESPYLEYLTRRASLDVPVTTLDQVAERLRMDLALNTDSNALMLSWVNRLRQCDEVERLPALFMIGDKLGFLDATDDVLRILGEELIGPRLEQRSVTQIILQYIDRPGMRSIVAGVGAHLETQIGNPNGFRAYALALSHDEIHRALARHAFEQQSLALFFRLLGARVCDAAITPQPRLDAFEECIEGIKALQKTVPDDLLENAFDAVWQTQPTFSEAIQLLDLLERMHLKNSGIPGRLVDLIRTCRVSDLQGPQQQLLERLGGRGTFYDRLGDKQIFIDAYRIPAELEISGDALAHEIEASIDHLVRERALGRDLVEQTGSVIARYLTQVKDQELHTDLLLRGYRQLDRHSFLESYLAALSALVKEHSAIRAKIAVRFIRIASSASKQGAQMVSKGIFDTLLFDGGKSWRSKELEQILRELSDDPVALRAWLIRAEAAKKEVQSQGLFGRVGSWIKGRDK